MLHSFVIILLNSPWFCLLWFCLCFYFFFFQDCFLQCWTWPVMLWSPPMLPVEKRGGKCTANWLNMYLDSRQGTLSAAFVIKGAEFHTVCVPFSFYCFKKIFFPKVVDTQEKKIPNSSPAWLLRNACLLKSG